MQAHVAIVFVLMTSFQLDASETTVFSEAVERASSEDKPIVMFSRPTDCRDAGSRFDPCEAFEYFVDHPAIQRRLDDVIFLSVEGEGEPRAVTVYGPGGDRAIEWPGVPDGATLRRMMNLIGGAANHLVASHRAFRNGEEDLARQERVRALFALGNEAVGRLELHRLRQADDRESRELAMIWLDRLDANMPDSRRDTTRLRELAEDGSSDRVRFEAWMRIAELDQKAGRNDAAIAAYARAAARVSESSPERELAIVLMQRAGEASSPVAGLGAPGSIVAGRRTIQPLWNESRTARVELRLDGRLVATARRPPFAVPVNFPRIPRRQELDIVALDSSNRALRSARVVVNERSSEFAVHIVEPSVTELSGASDVESSIRVPRGRTIDAVVVEWNGRPVARPATPPYRARIDAKENELGVLRVAVRLDDGSEQEDVRVFNAGEMILESEVHLVEVPVYSSNKRLVAADVRVREDGETRPVDRVIAAADAPLVVALVLDVSKSMENYVLDLEEAALEFIESLDEKDRVMVVAIDSAARVALWPTNDRERIAHAIRRLRVRGATALNDGLVTALLQIQAIGSRRAVVVMSDGFDNASVFSLDDVEEVAKRSAVPLYVLTINPRLDRPPVGRRMPRSSKMVRSQRSFARLGERSGGERFSLRSLEELGSYWMKIAEDLQNQSLVIYRPSSDGEIWRDLEISLENGGRLRAPSGVFVESGGSTIEERTR